MNRLQRAQATNRDRGYERVLQMTRWAAAGGGLALAVISVVLAQGPASASTAASSSGTAGPGGGLGPSASPSFPRHRDGLRYGGQFGGGGLQAPAAPPQSSYGSGPSMLSGGS